MNDLVNMGKPFSGLPMESVIGGPLQAACKAEGMLASAVTNFTEGVGVEESSDPNPALNAKTEDLENKAIVSETGPLNLPVISKVTIPSLIIPQVEESFEMEVESSSAPQQAADKSGDPDDSARPGEGFPSGK